MWMVKNAETVLLLMAAMIAVSMIAEICVALWLICYFRHGEDAMRVSLDPDAAVPTRAFATDAGLDLYSPTDIWVPHQGVTFIDTGVYVEICDGYAGEVRGRSGAGSWWQPEQLTAITGAAWALCCITCPGRTITFMRATESRNW